MESDGPYKSTPDDQYIKAIKAQAYAEGRKAAAQDFRELLEMVNRLRHNGRYNGGLKWVVDFEQEFDAWKKARGIE